MPSPSSVLNSSPLTLNLGGRLAALTAQPSAERIIPTWGIAQGANQKPRRDCGTRIAGTANSTKALKKRSRNPAAKVRQFLAWRTIRRTSPFANGLGGGGTHSSTQREVRALRRRLPEVCNPVCTTNCKPRRNYARRYAPAVRKKRCPASAVDQRAPSPTGLVQ